MSTLTKASPTQGRSFDDFAHELKHRLRLLPPNSRFSLEVVTNANGEIHQHRFSLHEDKGPMSLRLN